MTLLLSTHGLELLGCGSARYNAIGVKVAAVEPVHQLFSRNPTGTSGDRGLRFDSAPQSLHTGTGLLSTPLVELRT